MRWLSKVTFELRSKCPDKLLPMSSTRTSPGRDQTILELRARGWNNSQIGRYVGMTGAGVAYALQRLSGAKRRRTESLDLCDACWEEFEPVQLTQGVCAECLEERT